MAKTVNDIMERLHGMTMTREMAARADAIDVEQRTAELTFSSEAPYNRWFGDEILSHEKDAVDMTRLGSIGVLLWNHNSDTPIGRVETAWIGDDNRGHAIVRFDKDDESDRIFQKVQNGTLRGVSVGYRIQEFTELKENEVSANGRFHGPAYVASKWEPLEISIVSVPADSTVGVGRSISLHEGEEKTMETNPKQCAQAPQTMQDAPLERNDSIQQAIEAERKRVGAIHDLCRSFDMAEDENTYISAGHSVEEVRGFILDKLAKQRKPTNITVTADEKTKFRRAAIDGLALRAGLIVEKPADGYEEFRGKSLMRLAGEVYERETGMSSGRLDDETLIRSVFGQGTGAFPNILADVSRKAVMKAYDEYPTTYQYWTSKGSNPDFKPSHRVGLGAADGLLPMTENGEFKNAEVTDFGAQTEVHTWGRKYSITRKAIINDDLNLLSTLPARYGAAIRRQINQLAYGALTGTADLFKAANKNNGTGEISIDSLAAAKVAMAKQRDPSNKFYINAQPVYLIVPVELETKAGQLIGSLVDPTKANNTPNPFANRLTVIADPNLTDPEAWYLAAAPGTIPGIEVTYLNGKDTPTVESRVDFDVLGMETRIYMDFAVNVIDFRAFYKSTGK